MRGEHSPWLAVCIPHFIQISHFILFSKGKLKRNMMLQTSEKKKQVHLAKTKRRHRERSALPRRLTSCIFKRPVTRIPSHPGNEVRYSQREETLQKPQQICAYRTLQGLQACNSEGELLSTFDITNTLSIIAAGGPGEYLGCAGVGSVDPSLKPTATLSSDWEEMIPGVGLGLPQSL